MNEKMKRNDISNETGSSNWLSVIPTLESTMYLTNNIFARSFWVSGQKAFFDLKVFDPNVRSCSKQTLKQCYSLNENEKKRRYNTRIMEMNQGSFTPLVFTVAWGIRGEGRAFSHDWQRYSRWKM